ncbi:FAD-dependent oxidoreductase [Pelagibaca abyssi]|nr:FAD-dependent oxidoreductase [Salipiger abyssi]
MLAHARPRPFWPDTVPASTPAPALDGDIACDLAIVGGGFLGLWSAVHARLRYPDARIVVLDAGVCGGAASGRNGGFCAPSISHGPGNAMRRWPDEAETLIRLGAENLNDFAEDLEALAIEAEFERGGKLVVARTPWQEEALKETGRLFARCGIPARLLRGTALAEKLDSPVYTCGLWEENYALVNPAKLVAELRRVAMASGTCLYENTPVTGLRTSDDGVGLQTPGGALRAGKVILATNAARPLLRRLAPAVIPVYDYALMTAPLTQAQLASIGWTGRHGISDSGNQFHYLRKSADNRILWGGYDAIYHFGGRRDAERTQRPQSFARLAEQFAEAFPPLADTPFDYAWGGVIDTSARTTFFTGLSEGGRVAWAMGFTGQGVTATRFAALSLLDRLDGLQTERTRLRMTSTRPFPFPPEPLLYASVRMAQHGLAQEDRTGRCGLTLKALDALGIGFDS